jgi:hypothetical protein
MAVPVTGTVTNSSYSDTEQTRQHKPASTRNTSNSSELTHQPIGTTNKQPISQIRNPQQNQQGSSMHSGTTSQQQSTRFRQVITSNKINQSNRSEQQAKPAQMDRGQNQLPEGASPHWYLWYQCTKVHPVQYQLEYQQPEPTNIPVRKPKDTQ